MAGSIFDETLMHRRDFFGTATALAWGAGAWPVPLPRSARVPTAVPALDAHAHVVSPTLSEVAAGLYRNQGLRPLDGVEILRRMDAAGIRRSAVHSTAYLMAIDAIRRDVSPDQERRDLEAENDFAARECARDPERLIPFLSVNPKRDYALDEIDRCLDRWPIRGLKLHLWNSLVDTRQPDQLERLQRVMAHAADRGLPVLVHAFVGDVKDYGPDDTERLVREVIVPLPALRICVAHAAGAGGFGGVTQRCLERLTVVAGPGTALADRVWIDLAAVLFEAIPDASRRRFAELVARWGANRTLWGSDTFESYLDEIRSVWPLPDADWEAVCRNDGSAWLRS